MKKIAVIYKSKYGFAKKYAEWISKELSADLYESKKVDIHTLNAYDTIIYGAGIYAGTMNGISLIHKNFEQIQQKKIIIFTCGLSNVEDTHNIDIIHTGIDKVFPPDQKEKIEFFHFRGGVDYTQMRFVDKAIMKFLNKMLKKKDPNTLTEQEQDIIKSYGKTVDFSDETYIEPLIAYVKSV